jgi:hypothetical protein
MAADEAFCSTHRTGSSENKCASTYALQLAGPIHLSYTHRRITRQQATKHNARLKMALLLPGQSNMQHCSMRSQQRAYTPAAQGLVVLFPAVVTTVAIPNLVGTTLAPDLSRRSDSVAPITSRNAVRMPPKLWLSRRSISTMCLVLASPWIESTFPRSAPTAWVVHASHC